MDGRVTVVPSAPTTPARTTPASTTPAALPPGRAFTQLLGVTGLSNLADGVLMVGVPLLALTLTRSPAQIALLSAAATLPWLLLGLHAGVVVDRHDRVRVLGTAAVARVVVLVAGTAVAAAGWLTVPVLLGLLLALGAAEVFADSAAGALVPSLVPRERLGWANGRLLGLQQLANAFLGAPLAGPVVALGGTAVLGLPAVLLAVAAVLVVLGLRRQVPPTWSGTASPTTSRRAELAEGLAHLWRHRVLRPLVLTATVLNFSSAAYFAVFVLWVVGPGSAVGLDAELYGTLTVGLALGALGGAAVADRLRRRLGEARVLTTAWLANTVLLLVPVLVPHVAAITVAFTLIGFTTMVGNVVGQSLRQRLVPGRLLGRVSGVSRTLGFGSMPLGALVGGAVAEVAGLPTVLVGAVALSTLLVAWVVRAVPQRAVDDADRRMADDVAAGQPVPAAA